MGCGQHLYRHDGAPSNSIQIARQDRCVLRRQGYAVSPRNDHWQSFLSEKQPDKAVAAEAVAAEVVAVEAVTPEAAPEEATICEVVAVEAVTPEGAAALEKAVPQSAMTFGPDIRETLGRGRLEVVANRCQRQQRRVSERNRLGRCRLQYSQDAQEEAQGQTHRAEYSGDRYGGLRSEGCLLRHSRFLPSLSASCLLAATGVLTEPNRMSLMSPASAIHTALILRLTCELVKPAASRGPAISR